MWLRDAVGLATAAVAAHLLLVTVLPIANPSLLRDSRSRAPATKLSADERLERLERLLVTLDLRLEAMDERIKNIQLSADREADVMASPQPARPRTMRESRASKHAESSRRAHLRRVHTACTARSHCRRAVRHNLGTHVQRHTRRAHSRDALAARVHELAK